MACNYLEIYKGNTRITSTTDLIPGETLTVVVREDLYPGHTFAAWVDRAGNVLDPYPQGGYTEDGYPYFIFTVTCDSYFNALFKPDVVQEVLIQTVVNDEDLGSASGGGTFNTGDIITITAEVSDECSSRFVGWRKKTSGEFVSINETLTVVATESRIYEAVFELVEYKINLTINNRFYGTVSQSGSGTYHFGDTVTLTAEPNENCTFVGWYENNELISENETYLYTIGRVGDECVEERNVVARFKTNLYEIDVFFDEFEINANGIYII